MLKATVSKVMWVGRATVFLVGLTVILALVLGVATTAFGADGKKLLLGTTNLATSITTLVKQGTGPALSLQVDSGPPLKVNSSTKVGGLNADSLDGKDSSAFAAKELEAWHEVGAAGEPAMQAPWVNRSDFFPPAFQGLNTVGFYKDPLGIVHLKGQVTPSEHMGQGSDPYPNLQPLIFTLPPGYRPSAIENQGSAPSFLAVPAVEIHPDGRVVLDTKVIGSFARGEHIVVDGVTFRAAN